MIGLLKSLDGGVAYQGEKWLLSSMAQERKPRWKGQIALLRWMPEESQQTRRRPNRIFKMQCIDILRNKEVSKYIQYIFSKFLQFLNRTVIIIISGMLEQVPQYIGSNSRRSNWKQKTRWTRVSGIIAKFFKKTIGRLGKKNW